MGAAAPEADFTAVDGRAAGVSDEVDGTPVDGSTVHPFENLNKEFAFVLAGGGSHILWETTDHDGAWKLEHLNEIAFHKKFRSQEISFGKKPEKLTDAWMEWKGRRSYDGVVFVPERPVLPRFYNLWRGFAFEPWPDDQQPPPAIVASLDMFKEHALENVCRGDPKLFAWLMGYFAHIVQRPWEKPLVALVIKGLKGTGKNALVERVGALLGRHFLLASKKRYLVGNFNGHLENCLLFTLDEAFWSGDKEAEGALKDLITGKHHVIEQKGKDVYTVDNRTRVAILGNEEWLVPASHDERRFAVFEMGDARRGDGAFFQTMRERMEAGGYRLLLSYLKAFDLTGIDVNVAPNTKALMDQKHATLGPVQQWWLDCLTEGRLVASDFGDEWPTEVDRDRFRNALRRYVRERHIRYRESDVGIGHQVRRALGGKLRDGRMPKNGPRTYKIPSLPECRAAWDAFIGHTVEWPD